MDLIYGMGNSVAFINERSSWRPRPRRPRRGSPCGIAPAEELLWHRLFISERHRHDVAVDVVHLILCVGETPRLGADPVPRVGAHWPLLLAQLQIFSYVYPGYRSNVQPRVMEQLLERARDGANGHV